jgi:hypothetical protein
LVFRRSSGRLLIGEHKPKKVAPAKLSEILIAETAKSLGGDANFLAAHLKVRHRDGEPNWNASIDIFGSTVLVETFGEARERVKALYGGGQSAQTPGEAPRIVANIAALFRVCGTRPPITFAAPPGAHQGSERNVAKG